MWDFAATIRKDDLNRLHFGSDLEFGRYYKGIAKVKDPQITPLEVATHPESQVWLLTRRPKGLCISAH